MFFADAGMAVIEALERDRNIDAFLRHLTGLPLSVVNTRITTPPAALVLVDGGSAVSAQGADIRVQVAYELPFMGDAREAYRDCLILADLTCRALLGIKGASGVVSLVQLAGITPPDQDDPTWAMGLTVQIG